MASTPSPTPAGDDYEEPQDFFTTQLDDVYWRPGQEFLEGQAAVYQASTSCALPVHLDPSTPASLLPGRLQGGLTSCLSHMDPNYLQEGGINNSMPEGAVTPNADRGALHPDCDLFIGHHRDGTEAQRKEMAAMLNRMTPAVARTMEDLREGYKGIVPPMHIEKDNDKQAFTSPYRKPPIEKLAQDKKVMETKLGKRGLLKFSKVFIDDILVHSATFADHIKDVEAVLQCLIDIGIRIHPDKSCFALDAVDFLGFDVSNHGLTPQAAKVQAIKDLPYPNNLKDLKTILGAQHGNADALSRFPSPTAEDNTGARIDLDSDLYAAFPTVPTTPYVPLDLTLGHIVDYILDVRSVLSICTTPLPAAITYMAQNGITLYEMCGGMCAGLIAALRNGIQVNRGNTMLMHAVEYFSAALVVVPIPAKEAIHTVYAHSHGDLAHFGAYALCISDNGPEFQGKLKEHLLHNFIDHRTIHPNHPQGNGFVEQSVGTIKAALTKICSKNLATDTWDIDIAKVVIAYNCSPQETTKCAPFTLLYARAPVMNNPEAQLAMTAPLPDLTDSTQVQALTDTLLERAQWIKRVSPTIANYIAIAHHRDTLRYAKIRGGAYHPRLRKFQVGDFVYIRRPNVRNSLQMAAQGMILCIIDLKPAEVVVLQGRCVPVEDWFCPNCKASGITAIPAGRIPEAPQKEPNLFPTPQTRSRDRAALACDKMLVIKQVRVQGGLNKAVWGTASFQGPLSRPWTAVVSAKLNVMGNP
eukprot:gene329-biopygen69